MLFPSLVINVTKDLQVSPPGNQLVKADLRVLVEVTTTLVPREGERKFQQDRTNLFKLEVDDDDGFDVLEESSEIPYTGGPHPRIWVRIPPLLSGVRTGQPPRKQGPRGPNWLKTNSPRRSDWKGRKGRRSRGLWPLNKAKAMSLIRKLIHWNTTFIKLWVILITMLLFQWSWKFINPNQIMMKFS